jgi:5-methylcytosine-specific restriction enzyme subunit McrC
MTIPVRNIYYLLLYAWGHFKSGSVRDVGVDQSPDLPGLLGKVLNDGTHRLLRRGLDRGYIEVTEETRSPRGRLRLDVMTKQQTMLRGFAVCDLDELTPDVLHNQILKASMLSLATCSGIKKSLRHELMKSSRRMVGVAPIRLSADLFHRVQLSRNTSQYGFLMRVCELVFHALIPDDIGRGSKFQSILEDETRMPAVFEDFLRNFYRSELPGYSAASEIMPWFAEAEEESDLAYLPIMKTDITLRSQDRIIVADAKYYKEMLSGGRYTPKVRSEHLYQLNAYLAHVAKRDPGKRLSGLLIYPSKGQSLRFRYHLLGTPVTVATVDLGAEWSAIHSELIGLIEPPAQIETTLMDRLS